ncbi:hypothetical protein GYMLUDRAFT_47407 [Collybiopsis luxurians FD-317 M1]|uniref:Uncharacterized protein n=1 Tax=Collybiopsis luxurians FD-317 M1 TaxID=944289 RepID=A0A0D0CLZ1_9AGAR|nr:hypothetical protein GYMLUDRAFT_47407 [Collybiopsis luxurians FD-317 M1]
MFSQSVRNFTKQALQWSKIKLVYQRITLTRFTTFFFHLALINCIILVILQCVAFVDNENASEIITSFLDQANVTQNRIIFISDNELVKCKDLPRLSDADCKPWIASTDSDDSDDIKTHRALDGSVFVESGIVQRHHSENAKTEKYSNGTISGLQLDSGQVLDKNCLQSLIWLNEVIHDAMAEDIVTLVFQVWLFLLSFVTILNESLPHLGAAIAGHVLVTAWAGYRIENTYKLQEHYQQLIVQQACDGVDFLGGWWNVRTDHAIPVLIFNVIAFVLATYLASRLYKVYARETFNRVRASPQLHKIYKLVLVLSVCIQLAGFFTVASTAMWLDKASTGSIKLVAKHLVLYRAVFSTMAVLGVPWAILGWKCIRSENRRHFLIFAIISFLLLASSSAIFASPLYQFIFQTWPFFATLTIVSYLLILVTTTLGVWSRTQFGKGLPEFLKEEEKLEGADFAPVYIPDSKDRKSFDSEKGYGLQESPFNSLPPLLAKQPLQKPPPVQFTSHARYKTSSVYSDLNRDTVKLSSTPPLVQGILSEPPPVPDHPPTLTLLPVTDRIEFESSPRATLSRTPSDGSDRSRVGLPGNPRPLKKQDSTYRRLSPEEPGYF